MPFILQRSLQLFPLLCTYAVLDFLLFIVAYELLRLFRVSVNWVIWTLGTLLLLISIFNVLLIFSPTESRYVQQNGLIGIVSCLVAIYAASQWITRRWYLLLKRWAWPWVIRFVRNLFLFLRKHHVLLGWIVFATATAHGVSYIFQLAYSTPYELQTGLLVWGLLAVLTALGWWIEQRIKARKLARRLRWLHALLALLFLVLLITHI